MTLPTSALPRLVLASTSPYRRALLDRLGLPYVAAAPPYDEPDDPALSPRALVERHAAAKAQSLANAYPDALIIGSDQGLVAHGALLGKPGTEAAACAQLRSLCPGRHALVTAVALLDTATHTLRARTEVHHLTFRDLSDAQIAAYVRRDQPLDCAGSFKIESLGIALFEHIDGSDPLAIIGLPVIHLVSLLQDAGYPVL